MIHRNAGIYYCEHSKLGESPQSSDKLELVVTGVYMEKPLLTVDTGPQGFSEINATLHCHIHGSFNIFILCRDGNASFPQNCSRQDHNTFLISHVSLEHLRTYRCFGSNKHSSYLWSLPSEPLEFSIPESPKQLRSSLENIIRLIMAIIILLGLGALLLHAWKSRREPMGPSGALS
ncbi:immunoglobulin alpha Fc receptor-like [Peromyscus maniculatus bairdii]|uniref:immunoglobulin alpha Fc receptor-like n=1 Tax=Peromyscus maniculatus bairdii TaxID=230844 RepID=UPI003FCF6F15